MEEKSWQETQVMEETDRSQTITLPSSADTVDIQKSVRLSRETIQALQSSWESNISEEKHRGLESIVQSIHNGEVADTVDIQNSIRLSRETIQALQSSRESNISKEVADTVDIQKSVRLSRETIQALQSSRESNISKEEKHRGLESIVQSIHNGEVADTVDIQNSIRLSRETIQALQSSRESNISKEVADTVDIQKSVRLSRETIQALQSSRESNISKEEKHRGLESIVQSIHNGEVADTVDIQNSIRLSRETIQALQSSRESNISKEETQRGLESIVQSIRNGEAIIVNDEMGRPIIQYIQKSNGEKMQKWRQNYNNIRVATRDVSQANRIVNAKTDDEAKCYLDELHEHTDYLKKKKPLSGFALPNNQVVHKNCMYRKDQEYENTGRKLGSGINGPIEEIRDKTTQKLNAQKKIAYRLFTKEHILCWLDMKSAGFAPDLYLCRLECDHIIFNMEVISDGMTLKEIIDSDYKMDKRLLWQFSLYVLDALLTAVRIMHKFGWEHRDLHAENLILQRQVQPELRIRVLDFDRAQHFVDHHADLMQIIRIFSAMYTGQMFLDATELKQKWKEKLNEVKEEFKEELFELFGIAMTVHSNIEMSNFHDRVKQKLDLALPTEESKADMLEKIFPVSQESRGIQPDQEEDDLQALSQSGTVTEPI